MRNYIQLQIVQFLFYLTFTNSSPTPTNLTLLHGDSVQLNCTYKSQKSDNFIFDINPTWLKADVKYTEQGEVLGYRTENIIVTRKGVIAEAYRDKIKLSTIDNRIQTLTLLYVNAKDEGKYICRQFDSDFDKLYFIKVHGKHILPRVVTQ